jgi:hypothetical protein
LKPALGKQLKTVYLEEKKKITKKNGGVAQGVGPDLKPQYRKKTKSKRTGGVAKVVELLKA